MKKRALLIGAPGGKHSQYLNGVEPDLFNMREHLMSPQGGGWQTHEIITLENATIPQINFAANSMHVDYTIVYFSGHGSTDEFDQRWMHLTNGSTFQDTDFLKLNSTRMLMLVDACRTYSPVGIGFVPLSEDAYSYFDGNDPQMQLARRAYHNWIANCQPGKAIIHATNQHNSAKDMGNGGLFSLALLHHATKVKPNGSICSFSDIINIGNRATSSILKSGFSQHPTVVYKEGNIHLPFAMGVPEIKPVQKSFPVRKSKAGEVFLWSALAIGVIAALRRD